MSCYDSLAELLMKSVRGSLAFEGGGLHSSLGCGSGPTESNKRRELGEYKGGLGGRVKRRRTAAGAVSCGTPSEGDRVSSLPASSALHDTSPSALRDPAHPERAMGGAVDFGNDATDVLSVEAVLNNATLRFCHTMRTKVQKDVMACAGIVNGIRILACGLAVCTQVCSACSPDSLFSVPGKLSLQRLAKEFLTHASKALGAKMSSVRSDESDAEATRFRSFEDAGGLCRNCLRLAIAFSSSPTF